MRFLALDSWRGIAALTVALFHFNVAGHLTGSWLIRTGWVFVDFFFVLSGFVICHAYGQTLAAERDIRSFMTRRLARLYPIHLFTLSLFVAMELVKYLSSMKGGWLAGATMKEAFTGQTSISALAHNLLLVHAIKLEEDVTWNVPSWSISAEFFAYMVFGLLALSCGASKMRLPLLALCVAVGSGLAIGLAGSHASDAFEFSFERCLIGFMMGVCTYHAFQTLKLQWSFIWASAAELAAIAGALGIVAAADASIYFVALPLAFALVVWVFAHEAGLVSVALKHRAFLALGAWSYSIYMLHYWFYINVFKRPLVVLFPEVVVDEKVLLAPWLGDAVAIAYLAVVVAAAALTYRWIERPAQSWMTAVLLRKPDRVLAADR